METITIVNKGGKVVKTVSCPIFSPQLQPHHEATTYHAFRVNTSSAFFRKQNPHIKKRKRILKQRSMRKRLRRPRGKSLSSCNSSLRLRTLDRKRR